MINFKVIGQRIKTLRKEHLLTQEELAESLNISTEHLSRIETGSYRPSLNLIEKICDILSVDESDLMFGTKNDSKINKELCNKFDELSLEKKQALLMIIDLIK